MKKTKKAYLAAYRRVETALLAIDAKIHDNPAPNGDIPLNWSHVGDMNHIAEQLEEIAGKYLSAFNHLKR